jgi:hypothetical protein
MIILISQHNMDVIKEEPHSDEDICPISLQNEYHLTDTNDDYPVHATFFVVKTENEVRLSCYSVIFVWFITFPYCVALFTLVQDWLCQRMLSTVCHGHAKLGMLFSSDVSARWQC